ncbi:putative DNA modification/repair radical SAM protein [Peptoniphilus equinus]|uniref:DNA modification/repair radical SAM protein n=1 Tax=Peptoniphilus equinus TaxID=3016343 RepID=A0ABY7QTI3_9FIRM|nr:putative DNA modification/repair radical SAM protein [Peptoniphilus equinus]WBW49590.1 putative DNA modification/repair radical SAM protein [Peptoniphilus equinus]
MELNEKLEILTDAAKYDVSCSSSGSSRRNKGGLGNGHISGICHSWSEDGRCISLLKILYTNHCIYDCEYCINRRSHDTPRAAFTPREVAELTVNFYKRNYIEGLFLSSGVLRNPDYTMEQLIEVARLLREEYRFNGYIHMKAIPGCSEALTYRLGHLIDRMSVNIELPTRRSLALLAPDKKYSDILRPMSQVSRALVATADAKKTLKHTPKFVPAGQTTQMIIGAGGEDDRDILNRAESLYKDYALKRVYYSAFVPVVKSPYTAGIAKAPLLREHRIYQGDWLLRFYGFSAQELLNERTPNFNLALDPKANWAVEHVENFPIEVNRATYEELMRVPGFGRTYARRIIQARKFAALTYDGLEALKISTKRAKHFITVNGVYRGSRFTSKAELKTIMGALDPMGREQLSFF